LFDAQDGDKANLLLSRIELKPPNNVLIPVGAIESFDITSILYTPQQFSANGRPIVALWFVDASGQFYSVKETPGCSYIDLWKKRGTFKPTPLPSMKRGVNLLGLALRRLNCLEATPVHQVSQFFSLRRLLKSVLA